MYVCVYIYICIYIHIRTCMRVHISSLFHLGPADCNHYDCNRILFSESSHAQQVSVQASVRPTHPCLVMDNWGQH